MLRLLRFIVPFAALASVALAQKPQALGEDSPPPSSRSTPAPRVQPNAAPPSAGGKPEALDDGPATTSPPPGRSTPARPPTASGRSGRTAAPPGDLGGKPEALDDGPSTRPPSSGRSTPARPPAASERNATPPQATRPRTARPGPQPIPEGGTGGKPPALDGAAVPEAGARPRNSARPNTRTAPPGDLSGKPPVLSDEEARREEARRDRSSDGFRTISTGTGFVVADQRVLTNNHVVSSCQRVTVRTSAEEVLEANVLATDADRDLAILNVQGNPGPVLSFRGPPDIRRGDGVVTYGFPLSGLLSSGPTLTTGEISALAGIRDNRLHYQISAPVQPGNSGGPLLDLQGHVVGVIVSKLAAMRIAQRTGDIPQNVNFAIKGGEAIAFLREHRISPRVMEANGANKTPAEVGEIANASTLLIRCQRRR